MPITRPREMMSAAETLSVLDCLGIPYKIHKGAFVTSASIMLEPGGKQNLPGLIKAIEEHADELATLAAQRSPTVCKWCHGKIKGFYVACYVQTDGRRYSFHEACYKERREKLPDLPDAEVFDDQPGYRVLIEDSGYCCRCQVNEATIPPEAPNLCDKCKDYFNDRKAAGEKETSEAGIWHDGKFWR